MGNICTQCNEEEATTIYGFPVCEKCKVWLEWLDRELKVMEYNDAVLKQLGSEIEEIWEQLTRKNTNET